MTPDERRRYIEAFIVEVENTIAAIRQANDAQREAMDALIAANRAALRLFNDDASA
jgi:hypothetical protein